MQKEDVKNKEDLIDFILLELYKKVYPVSFGSFFLEVSPSGGIDDFRHLLDELQKQEFIMKSSEPSGGVPGFPHLQTIDLRYSVSIKGINYLKDRGLIRPKYKTAVDVLNEISKNEVISEEYFLHLSEEFQKEYLKDKQYFERVEQS